MHISKPWFICKNTLAGVGIGLMAATAVFYYREEVALIGALQVGVIGFFLFMYAKGRKHNHYQHYGGHPRRKHH